MSDDRDKFEKELGRNSGPAGKLGRAGLNALSGMPFIGGLLAAAAGAWSEHEQDRVNKVFQQWLQMLEEEIREKAKTIAEIMSRIDVHDDKVDERITSAEYQALLKKAFRNWSNIDSEEKRAKVRNLLTNAAASDLASDDVIRLFLDWIDRYSDFHFQVIAQIYRNEGITRGQIWRNLGRPQVREDSADADLFKLLIRDLSTGGVIRQYRETDYYGNFVKRPRQKGTAGSSITKSAFDDEEQYVLTELGKQFVHYAMTEVTPRISYEVDAADETQNGAKGDSAA